MAKNKNKRIARRSRSNLLPIAAVAVGIYLLFKDRQKVVAPVKNPPNSIPASVPVIGTRRNRERYINTYI